MLQLDQQMVLHLVPLATVVYNNYPVNPYTNLDLTILNLAPMEIVELSLSKLYLVYLLQQARMYQPHVLLEIVALNLLSHKTTATLPVEVLNQLYQEAHFPCRVLMETVDPLSLAFHKAVLMNRHRQQDLIHNQLAHLEIVALNPVSN